MKKIELDAVDWQRLFENGSKILVYGQRTNMLDKIFGSKVSDYACGYIHTLSSTDFILESFVQGEAHFMKNDIKKVWVIDEN